MENQVRATIAPVLDFILDILEASPEEIKVPKSSELMDMIGGDVGTEGLQFVAYLWNDENHSFQEVIDQVVEATGCTEDEAKRIAESVDEDVCFFKSILKSRDDSRLVTLKIPTLLSLPQTPLLRLVSLYPY